jgi:DNA-binding GntR family transcriptional regulator
VAEHIRQMIFSGELKTGDKVPQDAIAEELGISRIPVREALLNMARDGMVRNEPHVGAFVGEFNEQVVLDHFEIYGMLQAMAAVRLMGRADADELTALGDLAARVAELDEVPQINEASIAFTRAINIGSGSARLRAILRVLGRMYPLGFFDQVDGAGEAQQEATLAVWTAIQGGSEDDVREACLRGGQLRASLIIKHLTGTGAF